MKFVDNRQLLCTFTNSKDYNNVIDDILNFYEVVNRRIFAFSNEKKLEEVYLTYNVFNGNSLPKFPNTILIHRNKQHNVLFSINSLNILIKEENGTFDKNYIVEWQLYANSLILTGDVSVKIIPIKLLSIF